MLACVFGKGFGRGAKVHSLIKRIIRRLASDLEKKAATPLAFASFKQQASKIWCAIFFLFRPPTIKSDHLRLQTALPLKSFPLLSLLYGREEGPIVRWSSTVNASYTSAPFFIPSSLRGGSRYEQRAECLIVTISYRLSTCLFRNTTSCGHFFLPEAETHGTRIG